MAIYNIQIKTVARSDGHSATAKIAYIARTTIVDAATAKTHNYINKSADLLWSEITYQSMTIDPVHRTEIWNAAEEAETRKDSRTAREYVVALPKELTIEQNVALTREFAQLITTRYGNVADWAIHNESGGNGNIHAHILTTTREFNPHTRQLGERTAIEWNNEKCRKNKTPATQDQIKQIRLDWELIQNRHLKLAGIDQEVCSAPKLDRRTVRKHIGKNATQLENWGVHTQNGDHNRRIDNYYERLSELQSNKKIIKNHAKKLEIQKTEIEKIEMQNQYIPPPATSKLKLKNKKKTKKYYIYSTDLNVLFDFAREYGQFFTRYYDESIRQAVWISADKNLSVTKYKINIKETKSKQSIELAVELAHRKFGNKFNLNGDVEFVSEVIDIITKNPKYKNIELKNQKHQKNLADKKIEQKKIRNNFDYFSKDI